jgi:hypothetical protein
MSELDFSDSTGFFDLEVFDLADQPDAFEIPDAYAPPPELVLPGFVSFDLAAFDPFAVELPDDQFALDGSPDDGFPVDAPHELALQPHPGSSTIARAAKSRLLAVAKEGAKRRRGAAQAASEKARAWDADRHERAGELARAAAAKAKALGSHGQESKDALTAKAGASRSGAAVGRGARRVAAEMQRLPLLSAPGDVLRAKNAVFELTERFEAEPENPYTSLWLGEALKALERDTRVLVAARSALNPTTLLTRQALKTGAELGAESSLPASERMLNRAFYLADQRLRTAGFDAHALHVIARVYLAKRSAESAVDPAKLALADATDPGRGHFLFTLGRAYLAVGRPADARRAAELSIASGTTLGYELLAETLFLGEDEADSKKRHHDFVDLLARVRADDRAEYHGTERSGSDTVAAVLESQKAKLADTVERGKSGWRAARASIEKLRQPQRAEEGA